MLKRLSYVQRCLCSAACCSCRWLLSGLRSLQPLCAAKQELSDLAGQVWDWEDLLAAAQATAAAPSEVGRACAPQRLLDAPRCRY